MWARHAQQMGHHRRPRLQRDARRRHQTLMHEVEAVVTKGQALQQVALDEGEVRWPAGFARSQIQPDDQAVGELLAEVVGPLARTTTHVEDPSWPPHWSHIVAVQPLSQRVVLDVETVYLGLVPREQVWRLSREAPQLRRVRDRAIRRQLH